MASFPLKNADLFSTRRLFNSDFENVFALHRWNFAAHMANYSCKKFCLTT